MQMRPFVCCGRTQRALSPSAMCTAVPALRRPGSQAVPAAVCGARAVCTTHPAMQTPAAVHLCVALRGAHHANVLSIPDFDPPPDTLPLILTISTAHNHTPAQLMADCYSNGPAVNHPSFWPTKLSIKPACWGTGHGVLVQGWRGWPAERGALLPARAGWSNRHRAPGGLGGRWHLPVPGESAQAGHSHQALGGPAADPSPGVLGVCWACHGNKGVHVVSCMSCP